MTLSAMNARRLIKPRLVCECILVVWSAIYLGIAIRFWILLLWSLPLPCFAWSKWSLPQRAWVLRRADLQGEHGSLSFQSSLPHRVLPYSGLEKKKVQQDQNQQACSKSFVQIYFRWQFRSASCASLVLRTVWPSRSWFALDHTSSSSAGINIVIVNNIIVFFCSAGTHTTIVVFLSSSHLVNQHFSAQGFQTRWTYGDHGVPHACSRHCQVLKMSFSCF